MLCQDVGLPLQIVYNFDKPCLNTHAHLHDTENNHVSHHPLGALSFVVYSDLSVSQWYEYLARIRILDL